MSLVYRIGLFLVNSWAWLLDYGYVVYWWIYSFFSRQPVDMYEERNQKASASLSVILIPGIYENWRFMKPVAQSLSKAGYPIHVIEGLGYNTGTMKEMADIVQTYIVQHHVKKCVIIAHSKGGLIGKYLLAHPKNTRVIKGMIAINTPFVGSTYASFIPFRAVQVFKPNSPMITSLAKETSVNNLITSIYGLFDPHIPKGSFLQGARNIQVRTRGHFRSLRDSAIHQAILNSLHTYR